MTLSRGQRAVITDASVAVRFLLGERAWVAAWRTWIEDGAAVLVPAHFAHEVANALVRSVRLSAVDATLKVGRLFRTGFAIADRGLSGIEGSIELAERHRLSIYDAAYLDLALDVDGELATLDTALRAAAEAEGVALLG